MATTIFKLLATDTTVDAEKRTVEVICSTASPDRIGDVVVQEGIDITRYRGNPVVLWGHDSDKPVARAPNIFLQNGQLRALAEFPPLGEDKDSDWVYGKIQNRLVNAVSIGFLPKEWEPVDPKNPWDGYKFVASELVEFSFVSVPMNSEALIVGRSLVPAKVRGMTLPSEQSAEDGDTDQQETEEAKALRELQASVLQTAIAADMDSKSLEAVGRLAKIKAAVAAYPTEETEQRRLIDAINETIFDLTVAVSAITDEHVTQEMMGDDTTGASLRAASGLLTALLDMVGKAGRVLSAANENRLRAAHEAIGNVLDQLQSADPVEEQQQVQGVRVRQADVEGRSAATRFPRRTAREVALMKMRAA